jgi:hypothetical protein
MTAWLRFVGVQVVMLTYTVLGWVWLIPYCLRRRWYETVSEFDVNRLTDQWIWIPFREIYGNPSVDGVSGTYARIWDGDRQIPYMATAWPPWRAYCWNCRNSAGGLKYAFAWADGPLKRGTWFGGREWKVGWQLENGIKVPVLSL